MDKPMTFNEWMGTLGFDALVHANCCRKSYEAGQQSQQAKVEELQTQLSLQRQRVKAFEEELTGSRNYGDELQNRVDYLESTLKKCLLHGLDSVRIEGSSLITMREKIQQVLDGENNG
ncbi:hypothetical protein [Acinetobacter sp. NIPH 817]|uniref:hypothetical protein n=1 Tax=Acinetobacter sp. NIPH 817 TaxID=520708 RepID=UPI0002CFC5CE|nr:hypothetical protein [Acinetobacter sp. NIPH 817]ENV02424.1 hypothetical protein F968_02480 [Acinetobacter sp. NIPH 817]